MDDPGRSGARGFAADGDHALAAVADDPRAGDNRARLDPLGGVHDAPPRHRRSRSGCPRVRLQRHERRPARAAGATSGAAVVPGEDRRRVAVGDRDARSRRKDRGRQSCGAALVRRRRGVLPRPPSRRAPGCLRHRTIGPRLRRVPARHRGRTAEVPLPLVRVRGFGVHAPLPPHRRAQRGAASLGAGRVRKAHPRDGARDQQLRRGGELPARLVQGVRGGARSRQPSRVRIGARARDRERGAPERLPQPVRRRVPASRAAPRDAGSFRAAPWVGAPDAGRGRSGHLVADRAAARRVAGTRGPLPSRAGRDQRLEERARSGFARRARS